MCVYCSRSETKLQDGQSCAGIDEWVSSDLLERFENTHGAPVHVTPETIERINGWEQNGFIRAMTARGFRIKFYCEDPPCGGCWYLIEI